MKKTLSVILVIAFIFALPLQTFALIDEAYTYTLEEHLKKIDTMLSSLFADLTDHIAFANSHYVQK